MKFKLEIDMSNDAFDNHPGLELSTILADISAYIEDSRFDEIDYGKLHDTNGNGVGTWEITE